MVHRRNPSRRTTKMRDFEAIPQPKFWSDDTEWSVEYIEAASVVPLGREMCQWMFFVKWEGWTRRWNTWEPADHFNSNPEILEEFWKATLLKKSLDPSLPQCQAKKCWESSAAYQVTRIANLKKMALENYQERKANSKTNVGPVENDVDAAESVADSIESDIEILERDFDIIESDNEIVVDNRPVEEQDITSESESEAEVEPSIDPIGRVRATWTPAELQQRMRMQQPRPPFASSDVTSLYSDGTVDPRDIWRLPAVFEHPAAYTNISEHLPSIESLVAPPKPPRSRKKPAARSRHSALSSTPYQHPNLFLSDSPSKRTTRNSRSANQLSIWEPRGSQGVGIFASKPKPTTPFISMTDYLPFTWNTQSSATTQPRRTEFIGIPGLTDATLQTKDHYLLNVLIPPPNMPYMRPELTPEPLFCEASPSPQLSPVELLNSLNEVDDEVTGQSLDEFMTAQEEFDQVMDNFQSQVSLSDLV